MAVPELFNSLVNSPITQLLTVLGCVEQFHATLRSSPPHPWWPSTRRHHTPATHTRSTNRRVRAAGNSGKSARNPSIHSFSSFNGTRSGSGK